MTFDDILDAVLLDRFDPPDLYRARAKTSVNNRYAQLWALEDWTFKYQTANPTTATGDISLNALPSDFGVVVKLWDDQGQPLQYLTVIDFYTRYLPVTSGTPEAYTVDAQEIRLGPTPVATATFTLYYRKRPTLLSADSDVPALPPEFHSALIHGGRAELKAAYNDPTSGDDEQQWQFDLDAMRRDYLTDVEGEPAMWGVDPSWGYSSQPSRS